MKRYQALLFAGVFTGSILAYTWWGRFQYHHSALLAAVYAICGTVVVATHLVSRSSLKSLGLRLDNWRKASFVFGLFTLPAGLLILLLGSRSGAPGIPGHDLALYSLWALGQQFLLQCFLLPAMQGVVYPLSRSSRTEAMEILPERKDQLLLRHGVLPAILAAVLFALLHLPQRELTFLTLIAGFAWCFCFTVAPSLPAAWISHAALGGLALIFFKPDLLGPFQVGPGGYRYEAYGDGVQVAAGYDAVGSPLVFTLPGPDQGRPSLVRVYSVDGKRRAEWVAFPEFDFSGRIAVGELGFGPGDEVVVTPGPGPANPAVVRIFSAEGRQLMEFNPDLPAGFGAFPVVWNGQLAISVGPAPRQPAFTLFYSGNGELLRRWDLTRLGLFVNGVSACPYPLRKGSPAEPGILAWGTGISVNPSVFIEFHDGVALIRNTLPTTFGLNLIPLRARSGPAVAVAPGPLIGYPPWIRIFADDGAWTMIGDWVAFDDRGAAGANLAAVDVDGDGIDELVVGEGCAPGRPPTVRIVDLEHRLLHQWNAY